MKLLLDVITASTDYLKAKGIVNARREVEELIAAALNLKRIDLYLQFDRPLVEEELVKCRDGIKRRALGEPAQYIVGEVFFYGVRIKVTPQVLIPRPETEILIDKVAKILEKEGSAEKILWDMCTGSGYIAIALKKKFPQLHVVATDLSKEALAMAKENAKLNEVEITFLEGDLFAPVEGQQCNYFVCNPPYISKNEYDNLSKEVRDFEPKTALLGGVSGLELYERIAHDLDRFLRPNGIAWFEMGESQGEVLTQLFTQKGWQSLVEKDWSQKDRFLTCKK
jgi:release factor glutamine methyltransferase